MFFKPQIASISKPIYQKTTYIAYGSESGETKLFKVGKKSFSQLVLPRSLTNVLDLKFSSDGQFLAVVTVDSPYLTVFKIAGSVVTEVVASSSSFSASGATAVDWHYNSNKLNVSKKGTSDSKLFADIYGLGVLSVGYSFGYETIALRSARNGLNAVECSRESDGTYRYGLITYTEAGWTYNNTISSLENPYYAIAACSYNGTKTRFLIQYTESDGFNKLVIDVNNVAYQNNDPGGLGLIHSLDVDPEAKYLLAAKQSGISVYAYDSANITIVHKEDYSDSNVQTVRFSKDGSKAFSLHKSGDQAIKVYDFSNGVLNHKMTISDTDTSDKVRVCADWVVVG